MPIRMREKYPRDFTNLVHENSPFLSTIILLAFICRVFPAWVKYNFSLFSITGFSWFGYEFKSKSPCSSVSYTKPTNWHHVSRILTRKAANEQRLYSYACQASIKSLQSKNVIKIIPYSYKKAKFNPKLIFKWKHITMHWW